MLTSRQILSLMYLSAYFLTDFQEYNVGVYKSSVKENKFVTNINVDL